MKGDVKRKVSTATGGGERIRFVIQPVSWNSPSPQIHRVVVTALLGV
jgi:hypothetical protein